MTAADYELTNRLSPLLRQDARREGMDVLHEYIAANSEIVDALANALADLLSSAWSVSHDKDAAARAALRLAGRLRPGRLP